MDESEESEDFCEGNLRSESSSNCGDEELMEYTDEEEHNMYLSRRNSTSSLDQSASPASSAEPGTRKTEGPTHEFSIHRMDCEKLRNDLNAHEDVTVDTLIRDFVKQYNEGGLRADRSNITKMEFKPEPYNQDKDDEMKQPGEDDDDDEEAGGPFTTCLYIAESHQKHQVLDWLGCGKRSRRINIAWFFYRRQEIFALTTNHAYHLPHYYSQFTFPGQVAGILCSKDGPLKGTPVVQKLVGPGTASREIDKLPWLWSTYVGVLRENSSIHAAVASLKKAEHIRFRGCSIRFLTRIKIKEIPLILHHLSKVARGKVTKSYDPDQPEREEEERTDSYDCPLVEVDGATARELNKALKRQFRQFLAQDDTNFQFDLGHKFYEDYAVASKFKLEFDGRGNEWDQKLSKHPTLQEVKNVIGRWDCTLDQLKLKLKMSGRDRTERLKDMMEGELLHSNRVYWRARKQWLEMRDDYLVESDQAFILMLGRVLLSRESTRLPEKWEPRCKDVRSYTARYDNHVGYFVPHETDQSLFDLMHVDGDGTVWIFFITWSFSGLTALACQRINRCIDMMRKTTLPDRFKEFFRHAREPQLLGRNLKEFHDKLKKSRVVYALAQTVPPHAQRFGRPAQTLQEEKGRPEKVNINYIRQFLSDHYDSLRQLRHISSRRLYRLLRQEGYIDNNDNLTAKFFKCEPRSSFHLQHQYDFIRSERDRDEVYDLLSTFQSGFLSFRSRFELRFIADEKKNKGEIKFHIDEIEVAPADGLHATQSAK